MRNVLRRPAVTETVAADSSPISHVLLNGTTMGMCGADAWAPPAAQHLCPKDCSCGCQACAVCVDLAGPAFWAAP